MVKSCGRKTTYGLPLALMWSSITFFTISPISEGLGAQNILSSIETDHAAMFTTYLVDGSYLLCSVGAGKQ